jgi:hypothetical protein
MKAAPARMRAPPPTSVPVPPRVPPRRSGDHLGRAEQPKQGPGRSGDDVCPAAGLPLVDPEADSRARERNGDGRHEDDGPNGADHACDENPDGRPEA